MSEPLPALHLATTPPQVRGEMEALRAHLDLNVPQKREASRNLLVATWNIRKFGDLSEVWNSGPTSRVKRDWRGLWVITEILSRFDVIALQEVTGNLKALRTMLKTLGPSWSFLMTDVTAGDAGNGERMAYLFDTKRVSLSGLAGEVVLPDMWLGLTGADALTQQFDRTPYAVSFRSGNDTMLLCSAHIKYGNRAADRIPELKAIARWMGEWADNMTEYEQNFILLGDFNIDRMNDALWQAFVSTGLIVPPALIDLPRTIFADPANPQKQFYDQIAWFENSPKRRLSMAFKSGGQVDFLPFVYNDLGLTRMQISHRISDHYPLWAEFESRRA